MITDGYTFWAELKPPSITSPVNGAETILPASTLNLTASAFVTYLAGQSHVNTDWEIRTAANGGGSVTWSSLADATNLTSITVPGATLAADTYYYIRCRYRSAGFTSGWSADVRIQTDDTSQAGTTWTSRTSAEDNEWTSIAFGNDLFVAVAYTGAGSNRVMTSPDGITWTARSIPENNQWRGVCYSPQLKLFCAVALNGTNRVMTSPDGITWTARSASAANQWAAICWGNGQFVAVAISGTDRVMTSPDGITWTSRTGAPTLQWFGIDYGNGMYVAVAAGSTSNVNKFMRSTDGITWTPFQSTTQQFLGVKWVPFLSLWIVCAGDGTASQRIFTSPDGITFTVRTTPGDCQWEKLAYGDGIVVCVATTGSDRAMSSPDGINWTIRTANSSANRWYEVAYGNNRFVAIAFDGTGNRAMTSK